MLQVFIDFDGTIVDSKEAHRKAYKNVLSNYDKKLCFDNFEWFGKSTKETIDYILRDNHLSFSYEKINDLCQKKSQQARDSLLSIEPNKNILELLSGSSVNTCFTIFSNSTKINIDRYIDKYFRNVKWEGVCSAQEQGLSKMKLDELLVMVEKFRISKNILFIDDSDEFLDICNLASLPAIKYTKDGGLKSETINYYNSVCG